jgi:DNA-binding NarL/FixJ family response regulator
MTSTSHRDSKPRIRVLCVDDHPLVREAITRKIDLQSDMKVVASAATGEQAVLQFREHRPDVTLMDLQLPAMSGLEAIRILRAEDATARIIVLTMYQGDEDIHRALNAGAAAYVLKSTVSDDLVRAVREVHAGQPSLSPDVAAQLATGAAQPRLTSREIMVVELIATGMRNKEIAAELRISEDTVEVHIRNIFTKLNVKDRTAAVTVALRRGIIHLR